MAKPLFAYDRGSDEFIRLHGDKIRKTIGRSISSADILGTEGSYGFVVRPYGSQWVVKITTDESEAELWHALLLSGDEEEAIGFVRVHQIKTIDGVGWAIWREEVSPMTIPFGGDDGIILNSISSVGSGLWTHLRDGRKSVSQSNIDAAFDAVARLERDGKIKSLFYGFSDAPKTIDDRIAKMLAGGALLLQSEKLQFVARSFLAWAQSNVLLCDLSSYNIGKLSDGRFVIFDPSHALMVGY